MHHPTLQYYNSHAKEIAIRYETARIEDLQKIFLQIFPLGARILELGCGSGRDAVFLFHKGYDIIPTDGSSEMIEQAESLHPELKGSFHHIPLPAPFPFPIAGFDGVISSAVLMHLPVSEIKKVFEEVHRVLKPQGIFLFSVPASREDLDENGIDLRGRLFTILPKNEWISMSIEMGFELISMMENEDGLGREMVKWWSFVMKRVSDVH